MMKIKRVQRKYIYFSLIMIIAGIVISMTGFGIVGFHYEELKKQTTRDSWYQTVHISEDNLWYGVDFGNNIHLFNIGNAK